MVTDQNSEETFTAFRENIRRELWSRRNESGSWEGYLSSSALSTAVAVFALSQFAPDKFQTEIASGLKWLSANINKDGGFGDTVDSPSNISTTLLCWAAFAGTKEFNDTEGKIEQWLVSEAGGINPDALIKHVLGIYGKDKTFSVPILTTCVLSGRFGSEKAIWKKVPQLPFELASFPPALFRFLKLDVVSYALPALITIGLVRFRHRRSWLNPLTWCRKLVINRVLKKLTSIQPSNGGFLEATPLTAFVLMSLCHSDQREHPVALKCAAFLKDSIREDGSFPIDTNLHSWVTTLAINALTENPEAKLLTDQEKKNLKAFLMDQQYREVHPYTNTAPGGWAWSPLPGAVPDADDTSGALIALRRLSRQGELPKQAAANGINWLIGLQNSDGGIPTFCRGWGQLPFDFSCPDITAHCLRAFMEWRDDSSEKLQKRIDKSVEGMVKYLTASQRSDGAWAPLWFGNQQVPTKENLTYGTAQVVTALSEIDFTKVNVERLISRGAEWLIQSQNSDGSWGGAQGVPGSIEETALAVNALLSIKGKIPEVKQGLELLCELTDNGQRFPSSPIGLYFASLWYDEKMYPLVYSMAAVEKYFSR